MLQTIEDTAPSKKGNGLHYAFIICLGGFLTQAIVLSCQRLPAVALEPIRQTLGVSYADVGLITSVFMIFYAGLSIVWGMLGDKIGTRWAMTIACGLASIGALLFGFFAQYGLPVAIGTWAIAGVGTAGLLMAILPKIVSRWFAPHRRGFGMSLITPGANFSAIILGIIAPLIIGAMGWQWTYVIFGIVFAVITVFVAAFFREANMKVRIVSWNKDFDIERKEYLLAEKLGDFVHDTPGEVPLAEADVVLVEYPPFATSSVPKELLRHAALSIVIAPANRTWKDTDQLLFEKAEKLSGRTPVVLCLNCAGRDVVQTFTGLMPPYSRLRRLGYQISQFGFTAVK